MLCFSRRGAEKLLSLGSPSKSNHRRPDATNTAKMKGVCSIVVLPLFRLILHHPPVLLPLLLAPPPPPLAPPPPTFLHHNTCIIAWRGQFKTEAPPRLIHPVLPSICLSLPCRRPVLSHAKDLRMTVPRYGSRLCRPWGSLCVSLCMVWKGGTGGGCGEYGK